MACAGYLPADIDEMPFCDVIALLALWREQPPLAEIFAAFFGFAPKPSLNADDPSGIGGLMARAPDGRMKAGF